MARSEDTHLPATLTKQPTRIHKQLLHQPIQTRPHIQRKVLLIQGQLLRTKVVLNHIFILPLQTHLQNLKKQQASLPKHSNWPNSI